MPRIYTKKEIFVLRHGGKKLATIVEMIKSRTQIGVSGVELDKFAYDQIKKTGGYPSFLNHEGFPASTCISVNDEVVHSTPNYYRFQEGDIVGIDIGLKYKGFHTDMAVTVIIGKANKKINDFVKTARDALAEAIKTARPGKTTGDIGEAIQRLVEKKGYSIVRELSGHGVGSELHEEPTIPNFGVKGDGEILKAGMVIAIEPIINFGGREVETAIDGWRVRTKDKSISAHFEHTVLITPKGCEILTKA